jgi:hypothetical protein
MTSHMPNTKIIKLLILSLWLVNQKIEKFFNHGGGQMEDRIEKGGMILEGSKLSIFGDWGMSNGETWLVPCFGPTGKVVKINPIAVSFSVEALLNEDIQNGVDDRINHIEVDTHTAIMLFLEKRITRADIEAADADDSYVIFPPLTFNTKKGAMIFPIVVAIDAEYAIATIDANGEIV